MLQKLCYPEPVVGTGAGQDWTGSITLPCIGRMAQDPTGPESGSEFQLDPHPI